MRFLSCALLAAGCASATGAPSIPRFSDTLGQRPDLSLAETIKSGALPPTTPDAKVTLARASKAPIDSGPRFVSRMPIIVPATSAPNAMPIVTPDAGRDYSLTVREPTVESVK
jgi:hypothetical protein